MVEYASDFVFAGHFEYDARDKIYSDEEEEQELSLSIETTDQPDVGVPLKRKTVQHTPYESYRSRLQKEQEKQAAIREQEKRNEFRKLMGMKRRKDEDEESSATQLSCEDIEGDDKYDKEVSSADTSDIVRKHTGLSESQIEPFTLDDAVVVAPDEAKFRHKFSDVPAPKYRDSGLQKFFDLAKEMELRPIGSMKVMVETDTINLRYYGIDPRIVEVLSKAVENNTSIQIIDLTENWLTTDACYHLGELLYLDEIITQLDLTGCRIGSKGVENLERGIAVAPTLEELNLSRCDIDDNGLRSITTAISISPTLVSVNLSRNKLTDRETGYLGTMLMNTDSLKRLDVSWNSLGDPSFTETFFLGLSSNTSLEYLNMSGNGLGERNTQFLVAFLADSSILRELDLNDNRFDSRDAIEIATALSKNRGLEILRLGYNRLEPSGALAIINALTLKNSPNSHLKLLDLENVRATMDIEDSLNIIERQRPFLSIKVARVWSNYKLRGPDRKRIFLKRAQYEAAHTKKKKQSRNFGHFVLGLADELVSSEKFRGYVKKFKLKLSQSLIDEISKAFETDSGQIDLALLKKIYLEEYPESQPLPPKRKGKGAKNKGKTKKR